MITTAEGGAAVTSDRVLAASMERLRSHGITRASEEMQVATPGPWYYEQLDLGFNYRMPDLFAALGLSQLQRLEQFVVRRNEIAERYREQLSDQRFNMQRTIGGVRSSYHLVVIAPEKEATGGTQQQNLERLLARGVRTTIHYIPVYRHPFHQKRLVRPPDCPIAEWYYARAITLPCYPAMSDDDVQQVVDALTEPVGHQTIF
jgi:dTDP-4-amino-4,6-dideoxygalactose transaminase